MTSFTAGDVIVNTLHEWGVDTVFGIRATGSMA
jgi:thiamine pyrophosphate-dependent acetolactate synthase large subunit-like protein